MSARRTGAASTAAGALLVLAATVTTVTTAATARAEDEAPGPRGLELKVGRLERAQQADVVGAEESAVLFVPADAATLAAAAERRLADRRAEVASLFLAPVPAYRAPAGTDALFGAGSYAGGAPTRDAPVDDDPSGALWGAAGAALLAGGCASSVLRTRKGGPRWTATST